MKIKCFDITFKYMTCQLKMTQIINIIEETYKTGYVLFSDRLVKNLRSDDINCNEEGLQVKLGYGNFFSRLTQINNNNTVKFCAFRNQVVTHQSQETPFKKYFSKLFELKSRQGSTEEFFISVAKFNKINQCYNFSDDDIDQYIFCKKVLLQMIYKTENEFSNDVVSRKRSRQSNDDNWDDLKNNHEQFIIDNRKKPQSKQNQIVVRGVVNENEAKLSNWFYSCRNKNVILSSSRRMAFDEHLEWISQFLSHREQ